MKERIRTVFHRLVPPAARLRLRKRLYAIRPPRIGVGVGRGLLFDPGVSNPDYGRGTNEIPVQEALQRHTTPGSVVFDIGANVGFFTVLAARLVGADGRVFAFEPVPENAAQIRRNAGLNRLDNITVVEKAVTDTAGRGQLVLARYSGGAALSTAERPPDATDAVTVDLVTIDGAIRGGDIAPPSVVKIDVEGAEIEVLRGMTETLRAHRPTVICEIDGPAESAVTEKLSACIEFVERLGYRTTMLEDSYAGNRYDGGWYVRHFVAEPPAVAVDAG